MERFSVPPPPPSDDHDAYTHTMRLDGHSALVVIAWLGRNTRWVWLIARPYTSHDFYTSFTCSVSRQSTKQASSRQSYSEPFPLLACDGSGLPDERALIARGETMVTSVCIISASLTIT